MCPKFETTGYLIKRGQLCKTQRKGTLQPSSSNPFIISLHHLNNIHPPRLVLIPRGAENHPSLISHPPAQIQRAIYPPSSIASLSMSSSPSILDTTSSFIPLYSRSYSPKDSTSQSFHHAQVRRYAPPYHLKKPSRNLHRLSRLRNSSVSHTRYSKT